MSEQTASEIERIGDAGLEAMLGEWAAERRAELAELAELWECSEAEAAREALARLIELEAVSSKLLSGTVSHVVVSGEDFGFPAPVVAALAQQAAFAMLHLLLPIAISGELEEARESSR